jgi:hypothetical protein
MRRREGGGSAFQVFSRLEASRLGSVNEKGGGQFPLSSPCIRGDLAVGSSIKVCSDCVKKSERIVQEA